MTENSFDTLEFVGRRVPDYSVETDTNGHKYQVELPGSYEVGFRLQGVFRPIIVFPAAGLLSDIQRAENEKAAETSQASPPAAEQQQTTLSDPAAETSGTASASSSSA